MGTGISLCQPSGSADCNDVLPGRFNGAVEYRFWRLGIGFDYDGIQFATGTGAENVSQCHPRHADAQILPRFCGLYWLRFRFGLLLPRGHRDVKQCRRFGSALVLVLSGIKHFGGKYPQNRYFD